MQPRPTPGIETPSLSQRLDAAREEQRRRSLAANMARIAALRATGPPPDPVAEALSANRRRLEALHAARPPRRADARDGT